MAAKTNKYAGHTKGKSPQQTGRRLSPTSGVSNDKSKKSTPSSGGMATYLPWIIAALFLTLLAFYPSFSAGWVNWDDEVNVLNNEAVKFLDGEHLRMIFTHHVIGNYNPLSILSFALEWHFFQDNPFPYHLNNVILHLLCTTLVFILSKRLGMNNFLAFIITCLFGFQPMRVESVTWITERKDVLYGLFYLWALVIYSRHGLKNSTMNVVMILLMAISCLSKIQAVSLPLSMIAIDYLKSGKITIRDILSKWAYFLLALVIGIVGLYFLSKQGSLTTVESVTNYNFFQRIVIGIFTYFIYLVKLIAPYKLSPLYPYPGEFPPALYLSIIPIAGLAIFLYLKRNKIPKEIFFGLLFFTVNVMFMLQVLGAGQGYLADRFTYIGYFGLFFILAYIIKQLMQQYSGSAGVVKGITYCGLAVFWFMTNQQTRIWHDSVALWTHVLKYYNNASLPFWNRGNAYRDLGQYDIALKDYSDAIRLEPNKTGLYNSRGKLYFTQGKFDQASQDYLKAIAIDSTDSELFVNLAASQASVNNIQGAIHSLKKAIQCDSNNPNAYKTQFILNLNMGNEAGALKDAEKAIGLGLREADMYFERSLIYLRRSNRAACMDDLGTAIRIGGKNLPIYLKKRSELYEQDGNTSAAQADRQAAAAIEANANGG